MLVAAIEGSWVRIYVKWFTSTALTLYLLCMTTFKVVPPSTLFAALRSFANTVSFGVSLNFNFLFCDSRFLFLLFVPMLVAAIEGSWVRINLEWFASTAFTLYLLCMTTFIVVPPRTLQAAIC